MKSFENVFKGLIALVWKGFGLLYIVVKLDR